MLEVFVFARVNCINQKVTYGFKMAHKMNSPIHNTHLPLPLLTGDAEPTSERMDQFGSCYLSISKLLDSLKGLLRGGNFEDLNLILDPYPSSIVANKDTIKSKEKGWVFGYNLFLDRALCDEERTELIRGLTSVNQVLT